MKVAFICYDLKTSFVENELQQMRHNRDIELLYLITCDNASVLGFSEPEIIQLDKSDGNYDKGIFNVYSALFVKIFFGEWFRNFRLYPTPGALFRMAALIKNEI